MVGVIAIHSISKIWSIDQYHLQGGHAYHVIIGDMLLYTCLDFTKMSSKLLGRKEKWAYSKHLKYVFRFL